MQIMIYGLIDPVSRMCRYVGKTKKAIAVRLKQHIADARRYPNIPRFRWINGLRQAGYTPEAIELEAADDCSWCEAEQFWIAYLRSLGSPLLNCTSGGDGIHDFRHSDESKAKQSASAVRALEERPELRRIRGLAVSRAYADPDVRKKLSDSLRISHARPETKAKLCAAAKKKASTPEFKAAISAAHKGKVLSAETRAKISAARKGKKLPRDVVERIAAGHRGLKHSDATKEKMRQAAFRRKILAA